MLLLALTSVTDFLGLCTAAWLAGYLFSRGFSSRITLRTVLILLLLAGSFVEGYLSLHEPLKSHYAWYVAANLAAVLVWYNLTYQWVPRQVQQRLRWLAVTIYGLGAITITVALLPMTGLSVSGPGTTVANALPHPTDQTLGWFLQQVFIVGNTAFLLPAAIASVINFRLGARAGLGPGFREMWLATLFGAVAMASGVLSFVLSPNLPRLGLDLLVMAALIMLGLAVARHQAFVERRTTLQDLPVSVIAIVAIVSFYAFFTQRAGFSAADTALVTVLAVITHSVYDVARELLDRLVHRQESELRRQLRTLARDVGGPDALAANLQEALNSLVLTLRASGGFMAVKQGEQFCVLASARSLPLDQKIELTGLGSDDLYPGEGRAEQTAWLAPARSADEQLGAIGLGPRDNRGAYSDEDLDLLVEAADSLGLLLRADALQTRSRTELMNLAVEVETREVGLQAGAQDLIAALELQLDRNFERTVEQCLQHLADYTWLGQSGLVAELPIPGATHIERGKAVRDALLSAIDSLRPAGARPGGILPREWHAYTIMHDAYVEDVPNRDIMAKLYVSEGTFNRQRRKSLHAVARVLLEAKYPLLEEKVESLAPAGPARGG